MWKLKRLCIEPMTVLTADNISRNPAAEPGNLQVRDCGSMLMLDNRLADGGEVVSLTRRPHLNPQEDTWYSFLLEAESTPGPLCGWKD
jgi:hypothetical protein